MFGHDRILAKIKGNSLEDQHAGASDEEISDDFETGKSKNLHDPYWTLMDTEGNIYDIPPKMHKLLKRRDWSSVSAKIINSQSANDEKPKVMLVLKCYKEVPSDLKISH